jgi:hypothetical protein
MSHPTPRFPSPPAPRPPGARPDEAIPRPHRDRSDGPKAAPTDPSNPSYPQPPAVNAGTAPDRANVIHKSPQAFTGSYPQRWTTAPA